MTTTVFVAAVILAILLLYEGLKGFRGAKTTNDFFLLGGRLRLGPFVGTLAATNFSLGNMIFLSLIWGYFFGFGGTIWLWIGFILAAAVFVLFVSKFQPVQDYINDRQNSGSVHEYLGFSYAKHNHSAARKIRLAASLTTILCVLIALTLELFLASSLLQPILGIDLLLIFLALTVLIALYSALGGFHAVVITDIIQGFLLVLAIVGIFWIFTQDGLAITSYTTAYGAGIVGLLTAPGWMGILSILGVTVGWYLVTMDTWQRASASRSHKVAISGMVWGTAALLIGIVAFSAVGIYDNIAILPGIGEAQRELHSGGYNPLTDLYLLTDYLGTFGQGVMAFAALALVMAGVSTADTFLIVCGHSVVSDLMVGLGRGESIGSLSERESGLYVGVGRGVITLMGVLVLGCYFLLDSLELLGNPLALFYLAYSIQFSLLAPVLGTLWKRKPTPRAVLLALLLGIVVSVAWGFGFAIAGQQGVSSFLGYTVDEWVYLAPLPPMLVGVGALGVSKALGLVTEGD